MSDALTHARTRETDRYADSPSDPPMVDCEDCDGTGTVKCDGPRSTAPSCRFAFCYCEAAWESQQEAMASEPPPSSRERQERAQVEREALRAGRSL